MAEYKGINELTNIEGERVNDEDSLLETIKNTSENSYHEFSFEFNKDEKYEVEEILDLAVEMKKSKMQKAAALLLVKCINDDVSDIHVEPYEENFRIRVRIDGFMQNFMFMPIKLGIQIVKCLKNMAGMDTAERRASQDGKILRKYEGNTLEFRCNTVPAKHGEKMVLRSLNRDSSDLSLDKLIHIDDVRKRLRRIINSSNGLVIVSGPTGSGKSTTLAAVIREIDDGDINIFTVEDPVKYKLGGAVSQTQVNRSKGMTFASVLRTFLRQDPHVILVGETRDPETAQSSIDAAEAGHLVFTALHSNSCITSLNRLLKLEVPKYKLNANIRGVLAQRLLRKVCTECAKKKLVSEVESTRFGIEKGTYIMHANTLSAEEIAKSKREKTLCPKCAGIGYKGRIGIYELLELNRNIRNAISKGLTDKEVELIAINENSMLTLSQYGLKLVKDHLTTLSEVIRVCCN